MKKLMFALLFVAGTSYAAAPLVLDGGERPNFTAVAVSSTSTQILNYSAARISVQCQNTGNSEVYIGSSTAITAGGTTAWKLFPSTSTTNNFTYSTNGREAIYGITNAGSTGTQTVDCVEHKN